MQYPREADISVQWLAQHAPGTAALFGSTQALRAIRQQVERDRPDFLHDLSAMRRESIRLALAHVGQLP